jgi:hypothetical protein
VTKCLHFGDPSTKTRISRERYAQTVASLE